MKNKNKIILIFILITLILSSLVLYLKTNLEGYKEADVRGGVSISVPTDEHLENLSGIAKKYDYLFTFILISGLFLLIVLISFLNNIFEKQKTIEKNYEDIKKLKELNDEYLKRYQYAIEGTTDGIWDWNLEKGEVYFSKNWKKMLGFEDDEIENNLDEWNKRVHPDDKDQTIKDILDNQNKVSEYYQNTHRLKHKNGSWIWILDRGKTYFNDEGKAIRMVGFHSNITELKNLELSLADTKVEVEQLKLVVDNAEIAILIVDVNRKITYANTCFCKISGYTKQELIGNNPRILKFEEDKNKEKFSDLWNTIVHKKSWGGIFRNRKKDGSEYWETATILPILDENKKIINYLGIMREITKEVFLEKELREKEDLMLSQSKNAAMGEMISMIAHQWRQPITTISMDANNIIADIELESFDENEIKTIAEDITVQTQFLSNTIDDFRNFFKTDKEINNFEVKILFDELSRIILPSLKNNNISFEVVYEEGIRLQTYKRELLQVLLNIVRNAKEAFSQNNQIEDKSIKLVIENFGTKVKITISDNAGGIPDDIIDKIFDAYFTTKEEFNGTGLGLYMSKIIIEQHLHGVLKASNTEFGAEFSIILEDLKNKTI